MNDLVNDTGRGKGILRMLGYSLAGAVGLVLIALLAASLAAVVPLIEDWSLPALTVRFVLLSVAGALYLAVLVVGFVLARAVVRRVWALRLLGEQSASQKVVALAIVAVAFAGTTQALILAPLELLNRLAVDAPRRILQRLPSATAGFDVSLSEFLDYLFFTVADSIGELIISLRDVVLDLPLRTTALALVAWFGLLALMANRPTDGSAGAGARHPSGLGRLEPLLVPLGIKTPFSFALVLLFVGSTYLSVAAIAAVPVVSSSEVPEDLDASSLRTALEQMANVLRQDVIDSIYPLTPVQTTPDLERLDSLTGAIRDQIAALPDSVQEGIDPSWIFLRDQVRDRTASARSSLVSATQLLGQQRTEASSSWQPRLNALVASYEATLQVPMTALERADNLSAIRSSFGAWVEQARRDVQWAQRYVANVGNGVDDWARRTRDRLATEWTSEELAIGGGGQGPRGLPAPYVEYPFIQPPPITASADGASPPRQSSSWGPFEFVVSWLINTRSLSLALITGMLGFGLMGAAISSLVREDAKADRNVPGAGTGDMGGVVIRGLSAAVVVFLGVLGGLATFGAGDQQPNPYMLFFACLVGAVFSEDVWKWARERLAKELGNGGGAAGAAGGGGRGGGGGGGQPATGTPAAGPVTTSNTGAPPGTTPAPATP